MLRIAPCAVLAASLVLPGLLPAFAAPSLTAAEVVAREQAAQKAALPATEIEDWSVTEEGLTGTQHFVRRGDDKSDTLVLGPFTTRSGKLGGQAWHQNENGYTILDPEEPSQAAHPLSQSVTRTSAPQRLVVAQTMSSGLIERTFYDPSDLTIVRRELERDHAVFHVDYSDFRTGPSGRRKAWLERGSDSRGNTYEAKLTNDQAGASIADSDLAIPPNRRTLVEFPAGSDEVRLPAT